MNLIWGLILLPVLDRSYSDIRVSNSNLVHPDSAVLYNGVDNIIHIDGLDSTREYYITTTFGNLTDYSFINFNNFYLKGNSRHSFDTIVVYSNSMTPLFTKIFKVRPVPKPIVRLGNLSAGKISIDSLKKSELLNVIIPGCQIKQPFIIRSFQVYIQCQKCRDVPYLYNDGAFLSPQFNAYIPKLRSGDRIIFQSIKVMYSDNTTSKLPPVIYIIQ